jgi:hypothetical protein
MMFVKKKYFLGFILLMLSFSSCKKEKDESSPTIAISSPVENQVYNVYDYIHLVASITDDTKITAASVTLEDVNHVIVNSSVSLSVSSPTMSVDINYYIENIHIESGTYYLDVFANDGIHDTHAYLKINIIAVPKVLKTVFVTSNTTAFATNMSKIDSAFTTIIPYRAYTGDYVGSSVSSYYQQAYMCGNYTGNFVGIDLNYNTIKFTIHATSSSNPYFTGFYNDEQLNYVARYDGGIYGYDKDGSSVYGSIALTDYYAQHFCFNNDHLIAEEKDKTSATKALVTYYPTGSAEKNCTLTQDVVAFCEKDASNVFVFGNVAGQGVIQLFDRINNNLWNPYPFPLPMGAIGSAVKMNADTYLIGHSNGTIYKYQYTTASVTSYLTGYTAIQLKYDELNNTLYVVEANRISTFDYTAASLIHTVTSSENIRGINFLYNR